MQIIPPPVRWGIPHAVIVVALIPVALGAGYLLLFAGIGDGGDAFTFVLGMAGYAAVVVALIVIARRLGLGRLRTDYGFGIEPVDLAIGLGIAVVAKLGTLAVGLIVVVVTGTPPRSGNLVLGDDPLWLLLTGGLLATFVGPVVEELMFRGILLRAIRYRVLRGPRSAPLPQPAPRSVQTRASALAILVSSAAFAVLHLSQAPGDLALFLVLGLGTFLVGVLHAVITIVTGRLGAAMVSHVLFNGSSVLLQVLLAGSPPAA